MVIVPDSDIILIKSPLKLDNYNQITFSNATTQYNYFHGLTHLEYDNCTYQRKDGVIRYATGNNLRYEDLLQYNYCMYKNDSYKDKWFYAFVTDIKYVNDGMSEVTIETDVFQTWQFDIQYMNSFIEREHVSNDTPGLHTIPENLETGEYVVSYYNHLDELTSYTIILASTCDPQTFASDGGNVYGGVFQGFNLYSYAMTDAGITALQNDLMNMNTNQKLDAVVGIYLCNPSFYVTESASFGSKITPEKTPRGFTWGSHGYPGDSPITKLNSLNGYTPKNGKLKTYPYMYLLLDNGNGGQATYKYELFNDPVTPNICDFTIVGTPTLGGSYYASPETYGATQNVSNWNKYRLAGGKLPTCGFQNDTYINWLTQNAVSIGTGLATDTASIVGGAGLIASGGGASYGTTQIAGGISGIINTLWKLHTESLVPPQHVGNAQTGDANLVSGLTTFTAFGMTIKYEYAKMIDDFFTMYGYKVNRLATPNIHKRSNWDYIKCIDVNLEGNIPENDLNKIRSLFNNGCTFWHTTSNYLDYSQTNSIL